MGKLGTMVVGLAVGCGLLGCSSSGPDAGEVENTEVAELSDVQQLDASEAAASAKDGAPMRLEKALRAIDRGDSKAALEDLERLLEEQTLAAGNKGSRETDEVLLALSRAYEATGDHEAAIESVETILMGREGERPSYDAAEKRLRFLLTGEEDEKGLRLPPSESPPPIATALAELFEPSVTDHVMVDIYAFGVARGNHHGIFDIAEAKRQTQEQSMNTKTSVGNSITRSGSWMAVPHAMGEKDPTMPQADRSLLVFYFDLGDNRVPSRYDEYLPMPSDDIVAILERGDGVVMARKRAHGKPTIVIAAPRAAQLDLVEAELAKMTAIPYEPVTIALKPNLLPAEIQTVVRNSKSSMRKCYEAVLEHDPKAEGRINIHFVIDAEGKVSSQSFGEGSTLNVSGFEKCILDGIATLEFPASGAPNGTTVTYPMVFSP